MSRESDMQFFLLLAQKQSLAEAALELGITPSAVSRRLARVEERLGVRLLNRTTRKVSLTTEGTAYAQASRDIVEQIERLENSIAMSREEPRGLLRINATFQFGREHVAPVVAEFVRDHPEVEVRLILSDAPANLVEEGFDLSIRFGLPPASQLVTRLLLRNRRLLVASPAYLAGRETPERLADLAGHDCIVLRQETEAYDVWRFVEEESVRVSGRLSSNDGETALGWVLAGHGIMLRSEWDMARQVKAGRLRVVLSAFAQSADIYAVYPERLHLSAKVRLFVERLRVSLRAKINDLRLDDETFCSSAPTVGRSAIANLGPG